MKHSRDKRFFWVGLGFFLPLVWQQKVLALDITIRPSVSFQELYSDNINLDPSGSERSALVTEVSPGVSVNGQTARYKLNLNYRLQGIYNAGGNSAVDVNNQLQYNSNYVFVPNRFFLDTRSSVSQQNINNNRITTDNFVGGNNNKSSITTFHFSPYWTPHFSNIANGNVRATYDRVGSSSGVISDTNSYSQNVSLDSGRYFSLIGWSANFNNRTNNNADGQTISFQSSSGQVRYNVNRKFNLSAQFGHSRNDFQTTTNTNQNGFFYTFGGQWRPSRKFSVSAGWGNNSFVTVSVTPFQRFQWTTTYRNNSIGTNTGNVWQTNLQYNTRRSVWGLTYNEDTTTVQQVLLDQQIFVVTDGFGNLILDPVTNQPQLFIRNLPSLTNEVFVRKRGQLSYSFRTGKSNFAANAFKEKRTFQITQDKDDVYGVSGSWNWRFSPLINTVLRSSWQTTDTAISNDKLLDVSFRVQRNISRNISGNIEYRYLNQSSDSALNTYQENRISLGFTGRF